MRRPWLAQLVPVYRTGLWLKNRLVRQQRLQRSVISVGSLSAGGAGKTPVVMMVVEMLRDSGYAVDVLSRGYGRTGTGVTRVQVDGETARFGDEPMLLAHRLKVPVWVGADRTAAGQAAEEATGEEQLVHVLDDGFQHRRLARDVDVVLLTLEDVEDSLVPGGNLREDIAALERAHVIVLREEEAADLRALVPPKKAIWVVRRSLEFAWHVPEMAIVFCGIARPEGFIRMLAESGVVGAGVVRFKDHHRYETRDVEMLVAMAKLSGAEGFVTTEKDAVKFTAAMRAMMAVVGPICIANLGLKLLEGSVNDIARRLR